MGTSGAQNEPPQALRALLSVPGDSPVARSRRENVYRSMISASDLVCPIDLCHDESGICRGLRGQPGAASAVGEPGEVATPAAHVWTMRRDKAIRVEAYMDRAKALRAAGLGK
jgi:hypothetical protein